MDSVMLRETPDKNSLPGMSISLQEPVDFSFLWILERAKTIPEGRDSGDQR
jgi:hypothetical protein